MTLIRYGNEFPHYVSERIYSTHEEAVVAGDKQGKQITFIEKGGHEPFYVGKIRVIVEVDSTQAPINFTKYKEECFDDCLITNVSSWHWHDHREYLRLNCGEHDYGPLSDCVRDILEEHYVIGDFVEIVADVFVQYEQDYYGEYEEKVWFDNEKHCRLDPFQVYRFCGVDLKTEYESFIEPLTCTAYPQEEAYE